MGNSSKGEGRKQKVEGGGEEKQGSQIMSGASRHEIHASVSWALKVECPLLPSFHLEVMQDCFMILQPRPLYKLMDNLLASDSQVSCHTW